MRAALNKLGKRFRRRSRSSKGRSVAERFSVARGTRRRAGKGSRPAALPGLPPDRREFVSRPVCAGRARRLHHQAVCDDPRGRRRAATASASLLAKASSAANALLKSLEEPRPGVCFLSSPRSGSASLPTLAPAGPVVMLRGPRPARLRRRSCSSGKRRWRNSWPPGRDGSTRRPARVPSTRRWPAGGIRALLVQKAGRSPRRADGGPLDGALPRLSLPEAGHLHVNDLLAQCQESLEITRSVPLWSSTGWPRGCTSFIVTPGYAGGSQPPDPT